MFSSNLNQLEKQHLANAQNVFKNIYILHQQPEFQKLIQMLYDHFVYFNFELGKDINEPVKLDQISYDQVAKQSQKIINKNQELKEKILVIRARFDQLQRFTPSLRSNRSRENTQNIVEQIKIISSKVKSKILSLKEKRYLNEQARKRDDFNAASQSQNKSPQKVLPSSLSIQEMKKGTEFLAKKLVATKYDMQATQNILKN